MTTDPATIVEVCLALHLRRAARQVSRVYDDALAPHGLDISQFNLLSAIAAQDDVPLSTVAALLDVDPSTLSRTLRPLRDQNLIEVHGGRGRGGLRLRLTIRGEDTFNAASSAWKTAQSEVSAVLGEAQVARMLETLDALKRAPN